MSSHFGPWATAASTGSKAHLSTFWKTRLTLLPAVHRSSLRLGGRGVLFLLLAAILVWAMPTLLNSPAVNTQAADEPSTTAVPVAPRALAPPSNSASSLRHVEGLVLDENKHPILDAVVRVYLPDYSWKRTQYFLQETVTDAQGRYQLDLSYQGKSNSRQLVIIKRGFASRLLESSEPWPACIPDAILSKPASLRGRVTGPDGQPIAGANVWTPTTLVMIPGVRSATTDTNGYYEIPDLEACEDDGMPRFFWSSPTPAQTTEAKAHARPGWSSWLLRVQHPDYGTQVAEYSRIPNTVDVSFDKPSVVTGHVVDRSTGKPLGGIQVRAQGTTHHRYAETLTDDQGAFRLLLQTTDTCDLWLGQEKTGNVWTVDVAPGRTVDVAELQGTPADRPHSPQ